MRYTEFKIKKVKQQTPIPTPPGISYPAETELEQKYFFYTTENFMFVANGKQLDYLGVDRNIGFAGNGTYKVENDSLFEFMSHGTDNYLKWIEAGYKIYSVKISLTENHYTQYTIDSLGKGSGELYKRLE